MIFTAAPYDALPVCAALFRALPRRLLVFFLGCSAIAAIMLVLEHTVASIH